MVSVPQLDHQQHLRRVLDAVAEGIALWDGDGVLQYANPAALHLCGQHALRVGTTTLNTLFSQLRDMNGTRLPFAEISVSSLPADGVLAEGVEVRCGRGEQPRWLHLSCVPYVDTDGGTPTGAVTVLTNVTELQHRSESMARMANYDTLTGLPNRNLLADRTTIALAHNRRAGTQVAVCYLDLDGFKEVNDTYGHDAGDELLRQVARRLLTEVRGDDTVARLGGDEFVIVMGGLANRWVCEPVLKRTLRYLAEPYQIDGNKIEGVSASIGVAIYPADDSDPDALMRCADKAMYAAKRRGKNRFHWYSADHERLLDAHQQTLNELTEGLHEGQFALLYQPLIDCRQGTVVGAEALVRWRHPVLGELPPGQFIPLLEDSDVAFSLGRRLLEMVLQQTQRWHQDGFDIVVSVNLFLRQLQHVGFVLDVADLLEANDISTPAIEFEIGEGVGFDGVVDFAGVVAECRRRGIGFTLDTYAGNRSTPSQLTQIPVTTLKIDRSLIAGILLDPEKQALVGAIIALGRALQRRVVAVGVESREQAGHLLQAGCDLMQGFYFARPMAADVFRDWAQSYSLGNSTLAHKDLGNDYSTAL